MPRKRKALPELTWRKGIAYVSWYDPAAKRTKRVSLHTEDAGEAGTRYLAFLNHGRAMLGGQPQQRYTCGQALTHYIEEHVRPKVIDKQRIEDAAVHLRQFFGDVPVADVDIPMCREYTLQRQDGRIASRYPKSGEPRLAADGTVRKELEYLTSALNHALAWKRISRNDMPVIEKPDRGHGRQLWLTHPELARLRVAADGIANGRMRDWLELAYWTGSRTRAIETLTVFQIDLARRRINLAKADEPRTKKRRPIVPIEEALYPTVARLMAEAKEAGRESLLGDTGKIRRAFDWACRKADLETLPALDMRPEGRPTPHILRHTRATHLLQAGAKPWAVANLLGDTVQTVLRVYGHACADYMDEVLGLGEIK